MLRVNPSPPPEWKQDLEALMLEEKKGPVHQRVWSFIKNLPFSSKIIAALIFFIGISVLIRPQAKSSSPNHYPTTPVLVSLTPLAKGDVVHAHALKQIEIPLKDLTSKQRLDRLTSEQIENFSDLKMKAKKTIAPHGIIFWSDLAFETPQKTKAPSHPPSIIFSDKE